MSLEATTSYHLVKSQDLNHHGTFFAGRCAEWFVEAAFTAVARKLGAHNIVCLKIHGMEFLRPIHLGDILCFHSRMVRVSKSTVTVFVRIFEEKQPEFTYSDGFVTFCHVDDEGHAVPHNLTINPETDEEFKICEQANNLKFTHRQL